MAITTATSQQTTNATTSVVTLPASVAAGDMLLALVSEDSGAVSNTWNSGFTELLDTAVQSVIVATAAYKIAAGGETSVTATHTTERSNQIGVRIPAAEWANDGTAPVISTIASSAGSTAPDATGVTFGWSATHNTIFITVAFWDDSVASTVSAYPSGYTDNNVTNVTASSAGRIAMAVKPSSAASSPQDAGAFTISASEQWGAVTIAVKGLATGVTGSGGVTIPAPAVSATGAEAFTGSGGVTIPAPALSASGAAGASGSGGVTLPAPAIAATGAETFTGSGGVTLPAPTIAATGAEEFTGSGGVTLPAPAIAASGTHTESEGVTGTGAVTIPGPALSGTGAEGFTGSGGVTLPAPAIAGTGSEGFTGSGGVTIPAPSIAGDGTQTENVTGFGGVTIPAPIIAGEGTGGEAEQAPRVSYQSGIEGSRVDPTRDRAGMARRKAEEEAAMEAAINDSETVLLLAMLD